MFTEDDVGAALAAGEMSVTEAVAIAQGDEFVVYPAMNLVEGEETWQDVEELGTGSTLFADLHNAGATAEQMDEIGAQIIRARVEGRTMDKVFGQGTEPVQPGTEPVQTDTGGDGAVQPEPSS